MAKKQAKKAAEPQEIDDPIANSVVEINQDLISMKEGIYSAPKWSLEKAKRVQKSFESTFKVLTRI